MENLKTKRNIKPFNGEKYSTWKFRIRALLYELDVLQVVEEEPIIRDTNWDKGNRIAKVTKGVLHVTSDTGIQGVLEDVLYCPDVPHNLLSVAKMQQAGLTIIFDQGGARICRNGQQLADALTKPLPASRFKEMRKQMGLQ